MSRISVLPALAIAAALALSSCGSSTNGAGATTTAPAATAPAGGSTADTSVADTSASGSTPANGSVRQPTGEHAAEPFCVVEAQLDAQPSPLDSGNGVPSSADLEKFFTVDFPAGMAKLRAVVPDSLKADFQTVSTNLEKVAAVLKKHNWDIAAASTDLDFSTTFANAEFRTASDNLNAYCGLSS